MRNSVSNSPSSKLLRSPFNLAKGTQPNSSLSNLYSNSNNLLSPRKSLSTSCQTNSTLQSSISMQESETQQITSRDSVSHFLSSRKITFYVSYSSPASPDLLSNGFTV
ncbi:hypothetical protein AQUCO_06500009v1 [Aquilegia coerulea]|uniref:Uncharacterized protein n=1 Tax=Aquilegia coerulea TaxID=218851 RepID=A0A2G5CC76_AQUCA|nr:hypothetical protein AQUCO_06500009v1 [Aquilegia coerulea]